jgi:hypothetical protein
MYRVSGELDFDVRSGVANARLAAKELENVGIKARRSGDFVDKFAKRMFGARTASEYLAKTLSRLGPSLIGGAVGGTALGAIVNSAKQAAEEMNKLADSLDKAVGAKASETIGDTIGKINSITNAIEESANKISKQSPLASVAAFFMNEDADRAAKSFEKAVEERIRLSGLLVEQTAEQNAQTQITANLEGKLGEIYKINTSYRKRLQEIEKMSGVIESDKERLRALASQARITQTLIVLNKEKSESDKKSFEERKKSEEEFARTTLAIADSLQKQEAAIFKKNEEEYKRLQNEKAKAAEEASKKIIESSRKAAEIISEQDKKRSERFKQESEGAEFLLQDRPGEQALAAARKRRQIETTRENFRLREAALADLARKASAEEGVNVTKQDIRKRLAAQQAAAEMPSMAQKIMSEQAGVSPEIIASGLAAKRTKGGGAKEGFGGVLESLQKSIDELSRKIPAAVPQ